MADFVENKDQENKLSENIREEEEEIDDGENREKDEDLETNTSLLAGLNLVLILSVLSLSADECSNFDEIQKMETGDHSHKGKNGVISRSNLETRRREVNQFPAVERQTSKVHTKIRDCRHSRKF